MPRPSTCAQQRAPIGQKFGTVAPLFKLDEQIIRRTLRLGK
jgi:hypothetical protein